LAADFYLAPDVLGRLHYPISPQDATGRDLNDHLLAAASRCLPIHVRVDLWSDFAAHRQPFLLYLDEQQSQWMCELLLRTGWRLTLRARHGGESLFDVAPPL
jgi:hypothetical protein